MLPPPCLMVGIVCFGSYAVPFFLPTICALFPPKSSSFVASDHNILFQKSDGFPRWSRANARRAFTCLVFKRGVFPLMYSYSMESPTYCILANVCITSCRSLWSSARVVNGFCITFRVINRSAHSFSFRGRPILGRLVTTPYLFHFWMMALIVLIWILYLLEILRYPTPRLCSSTISLRTCCDSSFVFPMAWFSGTLSSLPWELNTHRACYIPLLAECDEIWLVVWNLMWRDLIGWLIGCMEITVLSLRYLGF